MDTLLPSRNAIYFFCVYSICWKAIHLWLKKRNFSVSEQRHGLPEAGEWASLFGLTIFNPQKQSAGDPDHGGGGVSELIYEAREKPRILHLVFQ